jgi:hypothetical protein
MPKAAASSQLNSQRQIVTSSSKAFAQRGFVWTVGAGTFPNIIAKERFADALPRYHETKHHETGATPIMPPDKTNSDNVITSPVAWAARQSAWTRAWTRALLACVIAVLSGCWRANGDTANKAPTRAPKSFRQVPITAKQAFAAMPSVLDSSEMSGGTFASPIDSSERTEQEMAANAIVGIGKAAVPELMRTLRGDNAMARRQAAIVLAKIGPDAKDAVEDLILALDDPEPSVRKAAARALGNIGPAAERAVPYLVRVMTGDPADAALVDNPQPRGSIGQTSRVEDPQMRGKGISRSSPPARVEYERPYGNQVRSPTNSGDSVYGSDIEGVEIESTRPPVNDNVKGASAESPIDDATQGETPVSDQEPAVEQDPAPESGGVADSTDNATASDEPPAPTFTPPSRIRAKGKK